VDVKQKTLLRLTRRADRPLVEPRAGEPTQRPDALVLTPRSRWAIVGGLSVVSFLLLLDTTAVSVALPSIQRQLGFGFGELEWVANVYTLAIAAFTLLAGHLADRVGAKRIFLIGLAIFVFGSIASGVAFNVVILIVSRAVQGLGAGLVAPASLALIATAFPDHRRGTALGVWAGVSASALGVGPLIGAAITDTLGWNWIFLLNAPLGILAWLLGRFILPKPMPQSRGGRLDVWGAVLSGVGLLSLILALNQGTGNGWTSTLPLLGVSALLFALFILRERRVTSPLVDLKLFTNRIFTGANIVTLLTTAVMCSLFFFLALYLQTVVGLTALQSGATLLPLTLTIILIAPLAGRLGDQIGNRLLVVFGMVILAVGLFGMSRLNSGTNIVPLMVWLAVTGFGIALARTPTTTSALGSAKDGSYGIAAGIFNTFQAAGLALGISLMGLILTAFGPQAAFSREQSAAHHAAFITGFSTALSVNSMIALAAAVVAFILLRPSPPRVPRRNINTI
jgi:EmrB/QacA subfamily drug resistance transporter